MTRLLTTKEVLSMTGYRSRATLWRKVRGRVFPAPVKLHGNALRWKEEDIQDWIEDAPVQNYGAGAD